MATYTRVMTFNAGKSRSGLSSVRYSLDGGSTWVTSGVSEVAAGTGSYKVTLTLDATFQGTILWDTDDGANNRTASEAINPPSAVAVSLPVPAPDTYGPVGTGSVAVNQDYPTTGNLAFKTAGGQGIGGAQVRAYLASEYAANPNSAVVRGQTITLESGAWANNINLDPGDHTLTFDAAGYRTTVINLTVS